MFGEGGGANSQRAAANIQTLKHATLPAAQLVHEQYNSLSARYGSFCYKN